MRITNLQLTQPQAEYVNNITLEKNEAINPKTKKPVSVDFSKDLFALFETLTPHKVIKEVEQIGAEVKDGYIRRELTNYYKVKDHYEAIRKFMREFTHTRLYQHLQSLNNPEKALEIILDMFSPPPPKQEGGQKPKTGQGQGQSQQKGQNTPSEDEAQDGQDSGQKQPDKDQPQEMDTAPEQELSNTPPDPLLDIEKFKQDMPAIEEILRDNVLDDEMFRSVVEDQAGTGHNSLTTIEGIAKNIKKIADSIKRGDFKILDVARKFDATEQYSREEEVKDVDYPEKDWRISSMKNLSDFPNILPYQFLYPNEIFDKMLIDKDLKVKQYQSRRKKKQVLYILIDVSGSMSGARQLVATSIAVAYLKKAISEKSIYFFRHFDDRPFDLHKVTTEIEATKEIKWLLKNPKSGGGTCINNALTKAIEDINNPELFKQSQEEIELNDRTTLDDKQLYERADILIITDGEDNVSVTAKTLEEKKVVLHTFLIEGENSSLAQISKTCQRLKRLDITKLIT